MSLAAELPDEAVAAFVAAVEGAGGGIKNESTLRAGLAAAIEKLPIGLLVGATIDSAHPKVLGVPMADAAAPDGWQPEGLLIIARGFDPEGQRSIFWRQVGDVTLWELVGMTQCAGDAVRAQIAEARG